MNKKVSLVFSLIFSVSCLATAFAIDGNTGRVIDAYKSKQAEILFDTLPFTETGANDILEHEYRMNGLDALRTRMEGIEQYYVGKKEDATEERLTLEQTLARIDASLEMTEKSITETETSITIKQQKIQAYEQAGVILKQKIASHRKIILAYLANLYSQGNLIMDASGEVDIFQTLILTDTDTDYILADITYKSLVSELGQKFIDEYKSLVREYYVNSVRSNEEKSALEELSLSLEKQRTTLESQRRERENLLEITQGQEALYVQYVAEQQKLQKQVSEAWQRASDDYQASLDRFLEKYDCADMSEAKGNTVDCLRIRQFFANEAELSKSEYASGTTNILSWPVTSRRVTAYFRDASYYSAIGSQHDAMDIGVPQGTDVMAPADGYVYYILKPAPGNYSYLAIKHKDGLVTVYGHLSEILVAPYQFVHTGDIIAKSGGMPGTPGAGPATTGPHLHMEVWKNREPVDPLRYMTTADINYADLPARYQTKFVSDLIEKTGSDTDTSEYKIRFSLKGQTEEERQKYLLATYAASSFQSWDLWVDSALEAKIDPSFLMCVGLAETTLGNHLKTAYNVGNIGNTDDGSTVAFSSAAEGLAWMAKTFNNKYLGNYTKISELSRWGNNTGPIYASSSSSWHDNTIRCLSALKGKFVEDDYDFRLGDG